MFVTEIEDQPYTYAHCADEDEQGNEFGCGMEYEFYPDGRFEDDLIAHDGGVLRHWHDAVGLVSTKRMTEAEWDELVKWHEQNCTAVTDGDG